MAPRPGFKQELASLDDAPQRGAEIDAPAPAGVETSEQESMHRRILGRVEVTARRRGLDRRAFLATSAGMVTTLAVAHRFASRAASASTRRLDTADPCTSATSTAPPGAGFRASFTRVDQASAAEWLHIGMATIAQQPAVADTILAMLRSFRGLNAGFRVDQYHHAMQMATMAKRDNANDATVLSALCHDIGKVISIEGHPEIAAALLRPYVPDENYQMVRTHQDFQGRWYYGYLGRPDNLRDQYQSQPWYQAAVRFTDEWDQAAFDPAYSIMQIEEFEPLVRQFFGNPTWRPPVSCA
jgi:predicted HD phosphohydrolase